MCTSPSVTGTRRDELLLTLSPAKNHHTYCDRERRQPNGYGSNNVCVYEFVAKAGVSLMAGVRPLAAVEESVD
jgi:hypothetical protein